jgi:hypothetical protein
MYIHTNIHIHTYIYRVRGGWGGGRGSSGDRDMGGGSGAEHGTETDVGGESSALVPVRACLSPKLFQTTKP